MNKQKGPVDPLRIRSIIVPLDGSAFAEQALPWAITIARRSGARLRLVMAHRLPPAPPLDETTGRLYTRVELSLRSSQRDYLHQTADRIKAAGIAQVATAMLEGAPAPALARYAAEIGADFVVTTTHARGGLQRAWLGSVADQLVRTLEIPMLLIRPTEEGTTPPSVQRLLVPLDGSRRSEAVLPAAMAVASAFGAEIMLLQVVYPASIVMDPPTSYPMGFDERITGLDRRQAQDYLDSLAAQVNAAGIRTSGAAVVGGSALLTIQAAADEHGTGVIALTTHGRGGVQRMVLGSVADKLVRGGKVPVLIIRPRGR